jgi:hypothetical protein
LRRAQEYDLKAIQTAFDIRNLEQGRYDLLENEILIDIQNKADVNAGLLGAAGTIGGKFAGNYFSNYFNPQQPSGGNPVGQQGILGNFPEYA